MYTILMHTTDSRGVLREVACGVLSLCPKGVLLSSHGNTWWADWNNLEQNGVDVLRDGVPLPDDEVTDLVFRAKHGVR